LSSYHSAQPSIKNKKYATFNRPHIFYNVHHVALSEVFGYETKIIMMEPDSL
jgi:hypothetical protein